MIKSSMADIAGNVSPALYLSVKSVCVWGGVDLSAGIGLGSFAPPRPPAVNRLRVRWLCWAELAESSTSADSDSCVCDPRGLHTWFVRLLGTAMAATLRSEDQSTPVLRSAAPVLMTSGLSALLEPLWTPQPTKSTVTMPTAIRPAGSWGEFARV